MRPKIPKLTLSQERFVIERLRKEWLAAERTAKRHEMVQKAKAAGVVAGKTLLLLLLAAGFVTVIGVAPNTFAALGRTGAFRRYFKTADLQEKLNYGSRKSYWRYRKVKDGEYRLELTQKGRKVAIRAALNNVRPGRQTKWDGKWRVVVFDIPRKRNPERRIFREKLREMGMVRVQDSVFAYPYSCAEEVMLWASLLNITSDVQIMESEFLTGAGKFLKQEFLASGIQPVGGRG